MRSKGVSTVVAMALLVVMLVSAFAAFYVIAARLDEYQRAVLFASEFDVERVHEEGSITDLYLDDDGTLLFEVTNYGSVTMRLVSLWINDTRVDLEPLMLYVEPGRDVVFDSNFIPSLTDTYFFKVVTERGTILSVTWPILTHIGEGGASVPPAEESIIIGRADWAGKGAKAKLKSLTVAEVKNIGLVAFKLNYLTRIIFTDVETGESFAAVLTKVTYEDSSFDDIGLQEPTFETRKFIYPNETVTLDFKFPDGWSRPTPGDYAIYLHLHGYDAHANLYVQAIYLGTYTLER